MAQITEGISYHRMKHISDWHMHEETLRAALAQALGVDKRTVYRYLRQETS